MCAALQSLLFRSMSGHLSEKLKELEQHQAKPFAEQLCRRLILQGMSFRLGTAYQGVGMLLKAQWVNFCAICADMPAACGLVIR